VTDARSDFEALSLEAHESDRAAVTRRYREVVDLLCRDAGSIQLKPAAAVWIHEVAEREQERWAHFLGWRSE
jgi:hypothetical protein